MNASASGGGIFASLRGLLATALEVAEVRLELLSTEVELEKRRLIDGLFWAGLSLMMLGIGVVLLSGFVVMLFWDGYRLAALGVLALLFLSASGLLYFFAQRRLRSPGGLFRSSVSELARDREGLASRAQKTT
ncbi:MAG: phage holin family protein [Gammaproteobacteria bacterium]|nr:phage holin family protein [Gammaproteobacteria bacterium]MBU0785638.1 phage holin family protein [Gammaproteobacteria bacterium]MBU0816927.1 phage holin family protein [Gammaproteobacteria bacterium]MBU1787091.1 phage holin family protein [Gammaproteobacteria bacterium]